MTQSADFGDPLHMGEKESAARVLREVVDGVLVFRVQNPNIYPKQADEIGDEIVADMEAAHSPRVLLDLSGVEFVCSAFLGRLIEMHKRAKERHGGFKVCVASPHVEFTAKLLHLNQVMEIGHDPEPLLRALRG
jgi:anti-anti-sigma factor